MNKLLLLIPLCLSACVSPFIAVPVALVAAIPVDRGINYLMGGTPGYTITSDDAKSRSEGSSYAKVRCDAYNVLYPYDQIYFSQSSWDQFHKLKSDHCDRYYLYESGELAKLKIGL